jgi:hypothetical protein
MLNRKIFNSSLNIVSNEKAPNIVFKDSINGIEPDVDLLSNFIDESKMGGKSKLFYFHRQFERTILKETDAEILVIDPYSEMNFQLWMHKEQLWKFWVRQAAIKDINYFTQYFISLGYRTLEESFEDTVFVIEYIKKLNPEIPIICLNQPIEYYPQLEFRKEFYNLGKMLEERISQVYAGKILSYTELVPVDLGTGGGPEYTLHFSAETYHAMIKPVLENEDFQKQLALRRKYLENKTYGLTQNLDPRKKIEEKFGKTPTVSISYLSQSQRCNSTCLTIRKSLKQSLQEYFMIAEGEVERTKQLKYRSAVIDLDLYSTYEEYAAEVKKSGKGARIRQIKKASRLDYYCHIFPWKLHIPDIYEINTSTDYRSGGKMKESYSKTIDEMGGEPKKLLEFSNPSCSYHWSISWGVFKKNPNYTQGTVETHEKLYGYVYLKRFGEFVLYSRILGHYDYLKDGIMIKLHHEIMEWILQRDSEFVKGLKYVMYAGYDQGNPGLQDWKHRECFQPVFFELKD